MRTEIELTHLAEKLSIQRMSVMPHMALYYFPDCPFCKKVVDAIEELELHDIELRDKRATPKFEEELKAATGRATVPCLRIESDGQERWMHESDDIVEYLHQLKDKGM